MPDAASNLASSVLPVTPPADEPESPPVEQPDEPKEPNICLSADQLKAAGVEGLSEGDTFTVTIHGTVTDTDENGYVEASVESADTGSKADKPMDEDEGEEPTPDIPLKLVKKPRQRVMSPAQVGMEE